MTIQFTTSEQLDVVRALRAMCDCDPAKGHKCKDKSNKYCKLCQYIMDEFIKQD